MFITLVFDYWLRWKYAGCILRIHVYAFIYIYIEKKTFLAARHCSPPSVIDAFFYVDGLSSFIVVNCRPFNGGCLLSGIHFPGCWLLCVGCRCQLLNLSVSADIRYLIIVQRLSVYRLLSVGVRCRWRFVLRGVLDIICSWTRTNVNLPYCHTL